MTPPDGPRSGVRNQPPDQAERERALDAAKSILVQAPAGSGKTDLLTRRFLQLLAEVDDPAEIVAITFTKAAQAEMRNRILSEIDKAAGETAAQGDDEFAMETLAHRALERSRRLGWNLLDLPGQLRISTIDSFCREIALRQPLVSTLGGGLDVSDRPEALYRKAAERTLQRLDDANAEDSLREDIEVLLAWRDNNWQEIETQLVEMLEKRDRWMQDFVLDRAQDWDELREALERPFARAVAKGVERIAAILAPLPDACDEMLALARFSCEQCGKHVALAEMAELPCGPFANADELEAAREAYLCMADFLLTGGGTFRQRVDVKLGFPADRKLEKQRITRLIDDLRNVAELEAAIAAVRSLPPVRYSDDEWRIVRACFALLHRAAGELQVVFAEAGTADYAEVAQAAHRVLQGPDGLPTEAGFTIANGIRHLLVDEFQDTSRRQHKLIGALAAAWADREERTVFVVGDPMQSIYLFREADPELFPRVRDLGLDVPGGEPLKLEPVALKSNFRTEPELVETLNSTFDAVFAENDASGVTFNAALAARERVSEPRTRFELHLEFVPQGARGNAADDNAKEQAAEARDSGREAQTSQIVDLIREHIEPMELARAAADKNRKYRVAVLGRTRTALAAVAAALRNDGIPFRAVDLETLGERPEILDAVALGRALLCAEDRVAWLGVLRAPWCGLSLGDLHTLTSADDETLKQRPVLELMKERAHLVSADGRTGVERLIKGCDAGLAMRRARPTAALGTWLERVWAGLGGEACVDVQARTNLDLLWRCLDGLAGGEADLLGPQLDAALEKLMAQPDPGVSGDFGVQLMTIHKSKGLEFEVVIVPDLQAKSRQSYGGMLAWLERGLPGTDAEEATEFLIAPFQPKGEELSTAKKWVEGEYHSRESQEMRRILYVAATRAREELHLFARPAYKEENGTRVLCEPQESLLKTAWPALEGIVRERFEAWLSETRGETEVVSIAAGAENVIPFPAVPATAAAQAVAVEQKPVSLRRLPADFKAPDIDGGDAAEAEIIGMSGVLPYARHEGGMRSRSLGSAVHGLFEALAQEVAESGWDAARAGIRDTKARVAAEVRAAGFSRGEAEEIAQKAIEIVERASSDPVAEWILSPHADAESEARWTGVIAGSMRNVQVDRVFRAGARPHEDGEEVWWIVDFKTAHEDGADAARALPEFRRMFAPQLEMYGALLRGLHGEDVAIRAGLYYPRMMAFDWWEM